MRRLENEIIFAPNAANVVTTLLDSVGTVRQTGSGESCGEIFIPHIRHILVDLSRKEKSISCFVLL